jgi:hypothetical protein
MNIRQVAQRHRCLKKQRKLRDPVYRKLVLWRKTVYEATLKESMLWMPASQQLVIFPDKEILLFKTPFLSEQQPFGELGDSAVAKLEVICMPMVIEWHVDSGGSVGNFMHDEHAAAIVLRMQRKACCSLNRQ